MFLNSFVNPPHSHHRDCKSWLATENQHRGHLELLSTRSRIGTGVDSSQVKNTLYSTGDIYRGKERVPCTLAPRPVTPPKPRTWLVGDEAWESVKREVERIKSARNEEEAKRAEELLRKREETEEERRVRIDKLEKGLVEDWGFQLKLKKREEGKDKEEENYRILRENKEFAESILAENERKKVEKDQVKRMASEDEERKRKESKNKKISDLTAGVQFYTQAKKDFNKFKAEEVELEKIEEEKRKELELKFQHQMETKKHEQMFMQNLHQAQGKESQKNLRELEKLKKDFLREEEMRRKEEIACFRNRNVISEMASGGDTC
ncbi:histone-lysine N-methyltransferase, H3 lysine-79 specific [Eurytemora carolleeae]|uniref:histone-lysine N-methyltransferase, H3 lysine-79 specific n=1 Tax=Eurytemora carolleeae TaxID=1294199 RepID=UPI000C77F1AE|nr:histone-lysine N-methyltransferase, H3 lysine-79 specific [Eurytemora carolleeae]|eukprot:XP_023337663.1 histone-lysine N-methyltransferase, H3 lysine-79 specific-like [Eurytemora affinis]